MEMSIKSLSIKDFKGIKALKLELDGRSATIAGRNGTGKTSVCDAFLWLLFGKDSAGTHTDVKPRAVNGERVNGVETEVEAVLCVDGEELTLRRQWHEVWTKDPTLGEKVYTRDETLCWVNGVPKKLTAEYTPYVMSLVGGNENTFKLISERGAFMRLGWNERRKELVKIAGGDAEADLRNDPLFADIEKVLAGASAEDAKKRLLDQRERLERELNAIPERIDELEKTLHVVSDAEIEAALAAQERILFQIAEIDAQLALSPEALQRMNDLYGQRRALEDEVRDIENDAWKPIRDALNEAEGKLLGAQSAAAALHQNALMCEGRLKRTADEVEGYKRKRESLLAEWHSWEGASYQAPEIDTVCPTCGQDLPRERIDDALAKHRAEWEQKRAAAMDALKVRGRAIATQIAECQAEGDRAQAELDVARHQIESQHTPEALKAEADRLREATPDFEENAAWKSANERLAAVNREIEAQATDSRRAALQENREALNRDLSAQQAVLTAQKTNERVKARIAELMQQRRDVGAQAASVERDLELLGRYARARCVALESAINRRFRSITWRMFQLAKNGSMIDCCDALVNGIAYSTDGHELNSGACTNADIEIINVLSQYYGAVVPCFVDNAESVNQIGFPGGQRILLRVTDDPTLTISME